MKEDNNILDDMGRLENKPKLSKKRRPKKQSSIFSGVLPHVISILLTVILFLGRIGNQPSTTNVKVNIDLDRLGGEIRLNKEMRAIQKNIIARKKKDSLRNVELKNQE